MHSPSWHTEDATTINHSITILVPHTVVEASSQARTLRKRFQSAHYYSCGLLTKVILLSIFFFGTFAPFTPAFAAPRADENETKDIFRRTIDCSVRRVNSTASEVPSTSGIISQTVTLTPGWNAVQFHIQPQPNRVEEVFRDIAAGCVFATLGTEPSSTRSYKTSAPDNRSLFTIQAHQSYLVYVNGRLPLELVVYGHPAHSNIDWHADQVNETGFPIDPTASITFGDYVEALPDLSGLRIQQVRREGEWRNVRMTDVIQPGRAYRISVDGNASIVSFEPFTVSLDQGKLLDYGRSLTERTLTIRNNSIVTRSVSVGIAPGASPIPLVRRWFNPTTGEILERTLAQPIQETLLPGQEIELQLNVLRRELVDQDSPLESALSIHDGMGIRKLIPVRVLPRDPSMGLWIGTVAVDQVSLANPITPDLYFDLELAMLRSEAITSTASGVGKVSGQQIVRSVVVEGGAVWEFTDGSATAGADWASSATTPDEWHQGSAPIGFGNAPVATTMITIDQKATYFRHTFILTATGAISGTSPSGSTNLPAGTTTLPNPSSVSLNLADFSGLELRLRHDDGAVVYLNGTEIVRANMPAQEVITPETKPLVRITGDDETHFRVFSTEQGAEPAARNAFTHQAPLSLLRDGENVLAVEVHQYGGELGEQSESELPTPAAGEFQFRVLLHVDELGQARLLKEVIQMRQQSGNRLALLTDASRIDQFKGVALRDGKLVGRRVSSAAYDFPDGEVAMPGTLRLTGTLIEGQTLNGTIDLPADFVTNPFQHKYHPDHDNLKDGFGTPLPTEQMEAYAVQRDLTFEFTDQETLGLNQPGWGDATVGGIYRETLTGLHKQPITVEGTFILTRASDNPVLNPDVTPAQ